jgi:cytochrome c peroxidase
MDWENTMTLAPATSKPRLRAARAAAPFAVGLATFLALGLTGTAMAGPFDLKPVPYPADNAYTPAKAELGKMLYFDPRLSSDGSVSCASCHNPALGWSNGQKFGIGVMGQQGGRSSPTVINSAYNPQQFWDGRAASLEEQAKGPIANPIEMGNTLEKAVETLKGIPGYAQAFDAVFPDEGITPDTIAKAIATYEREIVSNPAPFDAFQHGDKTAMSESAQRGWDLFRGKAQCISCHNGPTLSDGRYHDLGIDDGDEGRFAVTGKKRDHFKFKTPTLRDVALTAPYMHNSQDADLMAVMKYYNKGGDRKGNELKALGLNDQELEDLVAFMHALTGAPIVTTLPQLP